MTVSPGASLDSAIAGINRGVNNARKVAMEVNKNANDSADQTSSAAGGSTNSGGSQVGGTIDVSA